MNPVPVEQEKELLDAVDLRIVDMLCKMAGRSDDVEYRALLTDLALVCAEGSLCLPVNVGTRHAVSLRLPAPNGPLILHHDRLYFHRHFHAEKKIAEGLLARTRREPTLCDLETVRAILHEILETKPLRTQSPDSQPIQLTVRQKWALAAAMRENVFLLSGGPGTGKTALTASLLRALIRLRKLKPDRIRLCAPTGRAAQRLQESLLTALATIERPSESDHAALSLPVETLHHLLGYHPSSGRFARNPEDPLQADLVVLDEASMADAFTLAALIQALPPATALILVGDADQLPAVEAGSLLSELSPTNRQPGLKSETWKWIADCFPENAPNDDARFPQETIPAVLLDRSHRSGQSLLDLADAINRGDVETVSKIPRLDAPGDDFAAALPGVLNTHAQSLFLEQRIQNRTYVEWLRAAESSEDPVVLSALMEFLNRERILACARHGGLGCERINSLLRRKLEPIFEKRNGRGPGAFHGAPILITRNDSRTGLSNGEIGICLRNPSGLTVFFQRGDEWLRFPAAFLPSWEFAFATTVHKSQGSECDSVFLVLPEAGNRLLSREILYTAVTRARKSVKLFGSEAALREAVGARAHRHSGLRARFQGD